MPNITSKGRLLLSDLWTSGAKIQLSEQNDLTVTLSLIARHSKTARNLCEIMCGDGVHSGEWVNSHYEWLEKREAQVEARLNTLAQQLPKGVTLVQGGDPRGWVVRLIVTDENGVERTVGVD